MNDAAARECQQIGLLFTPLRQGGCPLACATQLEHLLAGEDDAAVDDPGHDGRELAGRHGDHRLVEQTQPFGHTATVAHHLTLHVDGERKEIGVSEARSELGRGSRGRRSPVVVAHRLVLEGDRHQHVSLLDALTFLTLDQALRPSKPPTRATDLAAQGEMHPDPEGTACCTELRAVFGMLLKRLLEDSRPLLLAPEHVGRRRKQLELLTRRRLLRRKSVVRLPPGQQRQSTL